MNRTLGDLRLLSAAAGLGGRLFPLVVAAAFALTWLPRGAPALLPALLTAVLGMLLWMRLGARLLSLLDQSCHACLPGLLERFVQLFALALVATVLLPALLYATRGADLGLALTMLLLSASVGVLLATLPTWATSLFGMLGGALSASNVTLLAAYPCPAMLLAALACALASAGMYRHGRTHQVDAMSAWTRPMWINLQQRQSGDGLTKRAVASQAVRLDWLQGIASPSLPNHVHRQPERAMRYALGPGFAPGNAVATMLAAVAMPALVLLLWSPLLLSSKLPTLPLILANVMATMSSVKFLKRLWLWRKQGTQGLMESALLPGLGAPGQAGKVFNRMILKRALAAMLPWLGLSCLLGVVKHAPPAYYPLVVAIAMTATMNASALLLACMRWPRGDLALSMTQFVLTMLGAISISQVGLPGTVAPHWLAPTWSLLLLGAVVAYNLAARQAARRPHPWLLN